jgi:hypothetical protein
VIYGLIARSKRAFCTDYTLTEENVHFSPTAAFLVKEPHTRLLLQLNDNIFVNRSPDVFSPSGLWLACRVMNRITRRSIFSCMWMLALTSVRKTAATTDGGLFDNFQH